MEHIAKTYNIEHIAYGAYNKNSIVGGDSCGRPKKTKNKKQNRSRSCDGSFVSGWNVYFKNVRIMKEKC